ncbi:Bile salt sulfotransferase [Sciurus carolinensis]|uniref:Sulfotransferase n=1 Tax=Sciurus carolinensis TaxID=30640 RepID=A0AA41MKP2_SCICA|nr:Bile salt sulfotransferase [Sciurus carolinensis]
MVSYPKSGKESGQETFMEKVIYLMRNPKDVLVSGYYFWTTSKLPKKPESLEQYFKWFIQGNVAYGSWFEHIRGWMSMRHRENILLLSYEELKKDPRSTIEKICQFLGKKLNPEELDSVVKNSSFHVMKQNKMSTLEIFPVSLSSLHFSMARKVGTHWLVEILCLIHSKGDTKCIQSVSIWKWSPWLETRLGCKLLNESERPRLLTSHLPFHLFPKSFFTSMAKVLYLMRNPKDVLVSSYYFWTTSNLTKKPESLERYFKCFIQGNVPYGSWFEHIRGWMSMRHRENVLLLSYEELQKDPRSTIEKICQFLGKKLKPEELDSVLKNSSFHVMKQNKMSNLEKMPESFSSRHFSMARKGICGDWKNHFTVAQDEAFNKLYQEKMAGFPKDLFPWE